jgi:sugar phosphate isomerase/epimerase
VYQAVAFRPLGIALALEPGARLAARLGFKGVHVNLPDDLEAGPQRVRALLQELGLAPAGFGLPVNFRGDEQTFRRDFALLEARVAAAAAAGFDRCSSYVFSWSDELDFASNFELHRRRLGECARVLAAHGARLGLEFLGPKTLRDGHRHEFIHTLPGMLELADAIGTGNVGLLLDAWHWYHARHTLDDIRSCRESQIVTVHVNDAPAGISMDQQMDTIRCLPAESGVIDLTGFMGALAAIQYSGPIIVEPFSERLKKMQPEEALVATMASLDAIWPGARR